MSAPADKMPWPEPGEPWSVFQILQGLRDISAAFELLNRAQHLLQEGNDQLIGWHEIKYAVRADGAPWMSVEPTQRLRDLVAAAIASQGNDTLKALAPGAFICPIHRILVAHGAPCSPAPMAQPQPEGGS